jgi:hypothetical protein
MSIREHAPDPAGQGGWKPRMSVESTNWSMAPIGGSDARVRSVIAAWQASVKRSASTTR